MIKNFIFLNSRGKCTNFSSFYPINILKTPCKSTNIPNPSILLSQSLEVVGWHLLRPTYTSPCLLDRVTVLTTVRTFSFSGPGMVCGWSKRLETPEEPSKYRESKTVNNLWKIQLSEVKKFCFWDQVNPTQTTGLQVNQFLCSCLPTVKWSRERGDNLIFYLPLAQCESKI